MKKIYRINVSKINAINPWSRPIGYRVLFETRFYLVAKITMFWISLWDDYSCIEEYWRSK